MDTGTFWDIIGRARAASGPGKPFHEALAGQLAARSPEQILDYQERYDQVHSALYKWDVWATAYLIGGGCSDDGFIDFRAGLIAQGRDWYEKVAACPDSLADHPVVADNVNQGRNPLEYEEVGYAASYAFQRMTGDEHGFNDAWFSGHAPGDYGDRSQDMGEKFDFDDAREMRRRLPRLSALFLGGGSA
jgi:hypothetical protein